MMRTIDMHAHINPASMIKASQAGQDWFGVSPTFLPAISSLLSSRGAGDRMTCTVDDRIKDMDEQGIDVQVLSTNSYLYHYDRDPDIVAKMDKAANDEMAEVVTSFPKRFVGLAALPLQDVRASVAELERSMRKLGLRGAMIGDMVNGKHLDDPTLLPFWKAAEEMGALIFIHQGGPTILSKHFQSYHLDNLVGALAERTFTFATLVFGGVMDKHPNLKICLGHGGGYTCFSIGRLDKGWEVHADAHANIKNSTFNISQALLL